MATKEQIAVAKKALMLSYRLMDSPTNDAISDAIDAAQAPLLEAVRAAVDSADRMSLLRLSAMMSGNNSDYLREAPEVWNDVCDAIAALRPFLESEGK